MCQRWAGSVWRGGEGVHMYISTSAGVIEHSRENNMIYARLDLTFLAFFSTECLDMISECRISPQNMSQLFNTLCLTICQSARHESG